MLPLPANHNQKQGIPIKNLQLVHKLSATPIHPGRQSAASPIHKLRGDIKSQLLNRQIQGLQFRHREIIHRETRKLTQGLLRTGIIVIPNRVVTTRAGIKEFHRQIKRIRNPHDHREIHIPGQHAQATVRRVQDQHAVTPALPDHHRQEVAVPIQPHHDQVAEVVVHQEEGAAVRQAEEAVPAAAEGNLII